MTALASKPLYCSFCGKTQREVAHLIAGPHKVFICSECVALCVDIFAGRPGDGCDDWFKVERPSLMGYSVAMAEARRVIESVGYVAVPNFAAIEFPDPPDLSGVFKAQAAAAMQGMNSLAADAKPGPKSDPAEPEPAFHVPKPVPPGPLSGAELHEVAVHAADSGNFCDYVGHYFAARREAVRAYEVSLS